MQVLFQLICIEWRMVSELCIIRLLIEKKALKLEADSDVLGSYFAGTVLQFITIHVYSSMINIHERNGSLTVLKIFTCIKGGALTSYTRHVASQELLC